MEHDRPEQPGLLARPLRPTEFWLLHAGLAAGSGAVFVLFKLFAGRHFADRAPANPLT